MVTLHVLHIRITELYYISGDRALTESQLKKCPQKHGGFFPKNVILTS